MIPTLCFWKFIGILLDWLVRVVVKGMVYSVFIDYRFSTESNECFLPAIEFRKQWNIGDMPWWNFVPAFIWLYPHLTSLSSSYETHPKPILGERI